MEIIKIESGPDCKIITCKCNWSPCTGSKVMRFLGDTYERTGWDDVKKEVYYQFSRQPVIGLIGGYGKTTRNTTHTPVPLN